MTEFPPDADPGEFTFDPPAGSIEASDPQARARVEALMSSPAYVRAYEDFDFLIQHDQRAVRLQLELLKAEALLRKHRIRSTIVVFGGTRIVEASVAQAKIAAIQSEIDASGATAELARRMAIAQRVLDKSHYYDEAREFGIHSHELGLVFQALVIVPVMGIDKVLHIAVDLVHAPFAKPLFITKMVPWTRDGLIGKGRSAGIQPPGILFAPRLPALLIKR